MKIGEVIRKYRKEKNMTQEEMANRLGVTAPAVNKWENGGSLPDVALLAPIARLLGISLDTLLSFREELTDEEIDSYTREAYKRLNELKDESYEETFRWAKELLETYPNCEKLILDMTIMLSAGLLIKKVQETESYEAYIEKCYLRVLESRDEKIRYRAADGLSGFYKRKKQYEQAERYLAYFSEKDPVRKIKQAELYFLTDRKEEACRAYEEILFSSYQISSQVLWRLELMAMKEEDYKTAHLLVDKLRELARVFEMGRYQEYSWGLDLAVAEKDAEAVLETMKGLLDNVEEINGFTRSWLYRHMSFKEAPPQTWEKVRQNLLEGMREEAYDFLRDDPRWQALTGQKG